MRHRRVVDPQADRAAASSFNPALDVRFSENNLAISYGPGVFGPAPEARRLDDIRKSLLEPNCKGGPDPVYNIAMDVGRTNDRASLQEKMLLFGVVIYAKGRLGQEPVRSQGHVHAISPHSDWSAPELFEFWNGRAVVYAQEKTSENPGQCFAIEAKPGDVVVVPPGWAHFVANADPGASMVFGAWCDREYCFVYDGVRARGGLAWYPVLAADQTLSWQRNPRYAESHLTQKSARNYPELGLLAGVPIYEQFSRNPETVEWVSHPARFEQLWKTFCP
jgi:glucose-6-phosphate isomerase